ncbi:LacI family DNA-binding transcriptional regulator [Actomonas aquatica]|uniref:LacI family DNA-binding transcriptional regulator n=1 Tax=Actomonas aquatica TaxID=2866162 RepID=A0ABZ1C3M7_9BACT|nr:LacI family DNA-binding transcriptional regulator [Opitutus sp. WL0086]WRQ86056.1 LacI family DNA-binding transcriptional regulator [Opitutus sp. WL0086]
MLLSDIAKQARVSPATVSRAINQPEIVAPASLERIRAVMRALDYQPPPLSRRRGPKSRRPATLEIGLWCVGSRVNHEEFQWFQNQVSELQERGPLSRVNLRTIFSPTPKICPQVLTDGKLDGVIIQGMPPAPEVMALIPNLPKVWFMTRRSRAFPGDYVEPDNEENGAIAANHLADRGHRTVAVLASTPDYSATIRRINAFVEQAKVRGLETHTILGEENPDIGFLTVAPPGREIEQLVSDLVTLDPRPTGLYLPSDHFAGAFFRTLRSAGQRVDRDYDVILGNYNPQIYCNLEHQPAAVDIHLATLIRRVLEQITWRIDNPTCPGRVGVAVSPSLRLPPTPTPTPVTETPDALAVAPATV